MATTKKPMAPTKKQRFLGKPMAHWEAMAKELVVDHLVRGSLACDEHSLPGKIARERLMALAQAEDAALVTKVLDDRGRFQTGIARVMADMLPEMRPPRRPRRR